MESSHDVWQIAMFRKKEIDRLEAENKTQADRIKELEKWIKFLSETVEEYNNRHFKAWKQDPETVKKSFTGDFPFIQGTTNHVKISQFAKGDFNSLTPAQE